jgi:hypothetical protein
MALPKGNNVSNHNYWKQLIKPDFSINKFVALGSNQIPPNGTNWALVSANGSTWATASTGLQVFWVGIDWSPDLGRFAAVSLGGSGMYSSDGNSWTSTSFTQSSDWNRLVWSRERGMFLSVGSTTGNLDVARSFDGINWSFSRIATTNNSYCSAIWVSELGLFVSNKRYSSDGISWSLSTGGPNISYDMCYSKSDSTIYSAGWSTGVHKTTDGINWSTVRSTPVQLFTISYSESLDLICIGANGYIFTTADSFSTQWATYSTGGAVIRDIAWSESQSVFVAVSDSVNYIWRSTDGYNWATYSLPNQTGTPPDHQLQRISFAP